MPAVKTEATELALAFGLIGVDPLSVPWPQARLLVGNLNQGAFVRLQSCLTAGDPLSSTLRKLLDLGGVLAQTQPRLFPPGASVTWAGPLKQPGSVTLPIDLHYGTTRLSTKCDSRVVSNHSPQNLFVQLPCGSALATRSPNWFLYQAPAEYDAAYRAAVVGMGIRFSTAAAFEAAATSHDRRAVQSWLGQANGLAKVAFAAAYTRMCLAVSRGSANTFNSNLASLPPNMRAGTLDGLVRHFLRLDAVDYVLAGTDHGARFAVLLPSLQAWKAVWKLTNISAIQNINSKQSEVIFEMTLADKKGNPTQLRFHAEVRWSHGKFCGNPEAKLYRDFPWTAVPGATRLI